MFYKMKWRFCKVNQEDYYFGEVHKDYNMYKNPVADGFGIYFENLETYFYGRWVNGTLTEIYVNDVENFFQEHDYSARNMEMIHDKFRVFTEYYQLNLDSEKQDLFHTEMLGEVDKFSVREYLINDLRLIKKVLKNIYYMFLYRKKSYAFNTYFMLINCKSTQLEFQLVTEKVYDPRDIISSQLQQVENRMSAYDQLIDFVNQLHHTDIVHDDIQPNSIRAKKNSQTGKFNLSIYDFSRARNFTQEEAKNGCKIKSLVSRSIFFRAPETLQGLEYNGKSSDSFSLALTLYAFELGLDQIGNNIEGLPNQITDLILKRFKTNTTVRSIFTNKFISKVLKNDPSQRPAVNEFMIKATTT